MSKANKLLVEWSHKMGPCNRPQFGKPVDGRGSEAHALLVGGEPVALTITAALIRERVAGLDYVTRDNAIELARLCASGPQWCRVMLRLWREVVFATLPHEFAVSYQDEAIHSGNVYRFDGWQRAVQGARSGVDKRSGRVGRVKSVWLWKKSHE
jgi:antitoxin VapB